MARKEILDLFEKYVAPFRISQGDGFRLRDIDPSDTGLRLEKSEAAELLQRGTAWLAEEQEMLYAEGRRSLLIVLQAMDAAGKDGTIKHVMSGVNPQGARCSRSSSVDWKCRCESVANERDRLRTICDFVAGMTDRYASEFYERLKSGASSTIFKDVN